MGLTSFLILFNNMLFTCCSLRSPYEVLYFLCPLFVLAYPVEEIMRKILLLLSLHYNYFYLAEKIILSPSGSKSCCCHLHGFCVNVCTNTSFGQIDWNYLLNCLWIISNCICDHFSRVTKFIIIYNRNECWGAVYLLLRGFGPLLPFLSFFLSLFLSFLCGFWM